MDFPVKLREIIEAVGFQSDEIRAYLNRETGEIVTISEGEFDAVEDQDSLENYPDREQDNIRIAREIPDNEENFLGLPKGGNGYGKEDESKGVFESIGSDGSNSIHSAKHHFSRGTKNDSATDTST